MLDTGGIHALTRFVQHMLPHQNLHLCNVQFQPMRMLVRTQKTVNEIQQIHFSSDLETAFEKVRTELTQS